MTTWTVRISGRSARTVAEFFAVARSSLDFPEYFGANWAAFDECLGDLLDTSTGGMGSAFGGRNGRPDRSVLIVVDHPENLLDREPVESLRTLVDIVREHAAREYRSERASLRVLLSYATPRQDVLPTLNCAGVRPEDIAG